ALRKLLRHREVFLQPLIDERSPLPVGCGDALVEPRVGFCHRGEGGPLHLYYCVNAERHHPIACFPVGFFSHERSSIARARANRPPWTDATSRGGRRNTNQICSRALSWPIGAARAQLRRRR